MRQRHASGSPTSRIGDVDERFTRGGLQNPPAAVNGSPRTPGGRLTGRTQLDDVAAGVDRLPMGSQLSHLDGFSLHDLRGLRRGYGSIRVGRQSSGN